MVAAPDNIDLSNKEKFSKIFLGSMPPDALEPFLFLNQLETDFAEKKKKHA